MEENTNKSSNFLTSFTRAKDKMIATNELAYQGRWETLREKVSRIREYTPEEVASIISSGSLSEQQKLSRDYFNKDGYYKQIILYYATLLKYMGILIPNPTFGKKLSNTHIQKRYYGALDYVERMQLPVLFANVTQKVFVEGSYYGIRVETDKTNFQVLDLPSGYACSRFKDKFGNDIIEFDVSYFGTLNKSVLEGVLSIYPKVVVKAWRDYSKGKTQNKWVVIPKEIGVCFPFFGGRPPLLNVIPATIEYDNAIKTHQAREADEIKKIIVQKIPHLTDGRLLFEPEEALEMHEGAVGMMKSTQNASVLTTYGDVSAISSSVSMENQDKTLSRIEQNIYAQAGITGQIFASTGSSSLKSSLDNDLALMMYLANKYSFFVSGVLDEFFGNANITFKYSIMPVTYYNTADFVEQTFKIASSGYSALLPALAFNMNQRDLVNVKNLENNILKVDEILKPLSSSYTQSAAGDKNEETTKPQNQDSGGRPEKEEEEKAEKTIENEKSLDNTGGS